MKKLILASASPRRREIFEKLGLEFEVMPSSKEPPMRENEEVETAVLNSAKTKAKDIFEKNSDALVVGADTVVVLEKKALGKPKNEDDAVNMLLSLSGREHTVMTGVYVLSSEGESGFVEKTKVKFFKLTQKEIEDYVKTGECMDKAGAYALQGGALRFVEGICGDYYNVVGFPAARFVRTYERQLKND